MFVRGRPSHAFVFTAALAFALPMSGVLGCAGMMPAAMSSASIFTDQAPSPQVASQQEWTPAGPGTVFGTIDEAAIDALGYAYLSSRSTPLLRRTSSAGAIRPVHGGFTYDEPTRGRKTREIRLRYRLAPTDVAHYRYEPRPSSEVDMAERKARSFVAGRDPLSRPLYTLTSTRTLRVFEADQGDEGDTGRVARRRIGRVAFGTKHDATSLTVAFASSSLTEDRVLAAQPLRLPDATR